MTSINSNNGDRQTSPFQDINGQKPEDDRKLFVGRKNIDERKKNLFVCFYFQVV